LDSDIYYQYGNVLTIGFQLLGVLVVVCFITPGMIALVILLMLAYYRTMRCTPILTHLANQLTDLRTS
jgi:hypothetical protein